MTEKINYRGTDYDIIENNYVEINAQKYIVIEDKGDISIIKRCHAKSNRPYGHYFFDLDISISDFLIPSSNMTSASCAEDLSFALSIFNKNVSLGRNRIMGSITKYKLLSFGKNDFVKKLLFDFDKSEVSNGQTELQFSKCNFGKKLKIRNYETFFSDPFVEGGKPLSEEDRCPYLQQNKAELAKIKITDCTADDGAYLRVGFLKVENFVLSNLRLPQNAELNIGDCHFQSFKLTNFRNIGKFKLYKINILSEEYDKEKSYNPRFQIDNTSIGKTDFQSVNLTSFARVEMFDNIFTEIDYTNVRWKREIEVGQYGRPDYPKKWNDLNLSERLFNNYKAERIRIAKKRDTYRTLKNVMIRNNDQQEALVFYQKEIEHHWQITKWRKEFANKMILAFNKYTNNFGLNWWKPLLWLIGFSIFLYSCLLNNLDMPVLVFEYWNNWFEFLNPTHKTKFIQGSWDFGTYAIDFSFRIIEGLLIYQTIQAFRKYSRKL